MAAGLALGAACPVVQALPPRRLEFPRDHGSHPDLRTEWWYITGQVRAAGRPWGFQVTFFRSRVEATQGLRSAFAARQLLFAHAALCDVQGQRLLHGQRIARAGFGIAQASEADTAVRLQDWSLVRKSGASGSRYHAQVEADGFALYLDFDTTQSPLLQGEDGLSRKGPQPDQASYYSMAFDICGILPAIITGWALDRLFKGNWAMLSLVAAVGMIFGFVIALNFDASLVAVTASFGLIGFMVFGPETILNGAATVQVAGEKNSLAVAGLVNGFGSIGPVIQERVIGGLMKSDEMRGMHNTNLLCLGLCIFFFFLVGVASYRRRQILNQSKARTDADRVQGELVES